MSVSGASIRATRRPAEPNAPSEFVQLMRRTLYRALVVLMLAGIAFCVWRVHAYLQSPHHFPIDSVKVEGSFQYVDKAAVQERVAAYSRFGFFSLDASALQNELNDLEWVERASVQRIWPDAIVVNLIEHSPVARWNSDNLFTREGDVIEPPQLNAEKRTRVAWRQHFSSLPFLQSESEKPQAIWQRFVQAREALSAIGVKLHGIHSDHRHAVTLLLDNGLSIRLGKGWFDQRLARFVSVYSRYIAPQIEAIAYVDMRYPNGFATGQLTGSES
ncbi:MAG: cell division protein FtsQ/DivIB [Pseudomonadota bacterium]